MAYEIQFDEPTSFAAGDRVQWKRTLTEFPITEGWVLKYYLRCNFQHDPITITATTSGTDYSVDLTPDETDTYPPGIYYWQAFVEKSGDRKPVDDGRFVIGANFATLSQPHDGRSHARRCLESIEAVLEGRATRDDQRYVLQAVGRSVDKMPIKDLLAFRDYYLTEVRAEEADLKPNKKNILIRFR